MTHCGHLVCHDAGTDWCILERPAELTWWQRFKRWLRS